MRAAILTAGCRLNQAESDALAGRLAGQGYELVPDPASADVCLINTCAVTQAAERTSVQLVRQTARLSPKPRIIVTGCLVQHRPEKVRMIGGVDEVWSNERKQAELAMPVPMRTRPLVKVQDGCDCGCAYCVVSGLRGTPRSVPVEEVLGQVRTLAAQGYPELVFTGLNLGRYDSGGVNLAGLLKAALECGGFRLRLGSLEPDTVSDALIGQLADERIVPHLHLALQTGSDQLLSAMGRGYDASGFLDLVRRIRRVKPDVNLGCDVIAGLPGEDEEAFARTCGLLSDVAPGYLHVFPYSARPGTKAAAMPGQLDYHVKKRRAEALRRLSAVFRAAYVRRFVGSTRKAVVETKDSALTDNYLRLALWSGCGLAPRTLVDMVISEARGRLVGTPAAQ